MDDRHRTVLRDLLRRQDAPICPASFDVNLETASERLIQWLLTGSNRSDFNVTGLLRSPELAASLSQVVGEGLGDLFGLMINLTNDVANRESESLYLGHDCATYHVLSHYVGSAVARVVEHGMRPSRIEASRQKLDELRAILIAVLGMNITARYNFLNVSWICLLLAPYFIR